MSRDFYIILVITGLMVIVWMGTDLFHTYKNFEIPQEFSELGRPIDLTLNEEVLDQLKTVDQ